jgi:UDP-4-amino-4,6-dideoxy-N-acetyl-beta-L-altrosamine N-acetyltransferase
MIVIGYGVKLIRLRHEHIELVRQKRNSEQVKMHMEYREEISPEMQEEWFRKINNRNNNYFIIEYKGEQIGLIYGAEINWEKKETGNGGIFIWNEKYIDTPATLAASFLLTEISFLLGMERTYIKVLPENERAIHFNRDQGYEILPDQENKKNQKYVLTRESYFEKAEKFRKPFLRWHGEIFEIHIEFPEDESEKNIVEVYSGLNEEIKNKMKLIFD